MHLCIFKAACWIDWVLIVFPGVLEGSARGIDQSQTRPLTLGGWQGPALCCMQREMQAEVMAGQGKARQPTREEEPLLGCIGKQSFSIKIGNSEPPAGSSHAIKSEELCCLIFKDNV